MAVAITPDQLLDYLVEAFVDDFWHGRLEIEESGWRCIANLPGQPVKSRKLARELFQCGWLDTHPEDSQPAQRIRIKLCWITLDMSDEELCQDEQAEEI